jgi:hypothetical protein
MIWTWYDHGGCALAHNGVAPGRVRLLVDWEVRVVDQLREVDGVAALEVEVDADSLVFEDHLQLSERRHHLLLMNRRSPFGFLLKVGARLFARALHDGHHHVAANIGHGRKNAHQNVRFSTRRSRRLFFSKYRRICCRGGFCVVHSALNGTP